MGSLCMSRRITLVAWPPNMSFQLDHVFPSFVSGRSPLAERVAETVGETPARPGVRVEVPRSLAAKHEIGGVAVCATPAMKRRETLASAWVSLYPLLSSICGQPYGLQIRSSLEARRATTALKSQIATIQAIGPPFGWVGGTRHIGKEREVWRHACGNRFRRRL